MSSTPLPTPATLKDTTAQYLAIEAKIMQGGGKVAIDRQHEKGRLTARERIALLVDPPQQSRERERATNQPSDASLADARGSANFQELGLWAAHEMYKEFGGAPAAGVVTGIGVVQGRRHMIIANDATVKAGAFFPMTCKKIIRAQTIAQMARLPLIYLVDSAGVFLPLQEDVFPDTDDFGRIFRNNAVISAEGIPQIAAIMGFCVAGGGYLPVLCDTLLMTEGSGLYLAGPALVKAAIGQEVTDEELGGAEMHASISGTIDFKEKDDAACIARIRELVSKYPAEDARQWALQLSRLTYQLLPTQVNESNLGTWHQELKDAAKRLVASKDLPEGARRALADAAARRELERDLEYRLSALADEAAIRDDERLAKCLQPFSAAVEGSRARPFRSGEELFAVFSDKPGVQYDAKQIIECLVDVRADKDPQGRESLAPNFDEYKADYGLSIVCGYAKLGGHACGIVANQKKLVQRTMAGGKAGPSKAVQMPGVIYDDSADKAARFIMDCNQRKIPLIFLHDTTGFMVGRDSEQGGIIRAGAKMVNAMANCVVPKIVLITGGSYGAGNYAMCGRAFDPFLTFAWPGAKCAVMGANQATGVLATIEEASRKRKGETIDPETHKQISAAIHAGYTEQADIRHAASRGWIDRIIEPHKTREELIAALEATRGWDYSKAYKTGVLQT